MTTEDIRKSNGCQLKNPDISGAIFTLSLSIRILNSQCIEGARDVRILKLTPVTSAKFVFVLASNPTQGLG